MTSSTFRVHLYFIRHAQSEANLNRHIICGQCISSNLTELGREQAKLLGLMNMFLF